MFRREVLEHQLVLGRRRGMLVVFEDRFGMLAGRVRVV
jgi:hypothetical protein